MSIKNQKLDDFSENSLHNTIAQMKNCQISSVIKDLKKHLPNAKIFVCVLTTLQIKLPEVAFKSGAHIIYEKKG